MKKPSPKPSGHRKPKKSAKKPTQPPDGRGPRPKDPNRFAEWIVEQTTGKKRQ